MLECAEAMSLRVEGWLEGSGESSAGVFGVAWSMLAVDSTVWAVDSTRVDSAGIDSVGVDCVAGMGRVLVRAKGVLEDWGFGLAGVKVKLGAGWSV